MYGIHVSMYLAHASTHRMCLVLSELEGTELKVITS